MLIAGAGGFVGTCLRYLVGKWCSVIFSGTFPLGTFMVNMVGCFLIGLFCGFLEKSQIVTAGENLLLITGFCGGFTTFSSFANDMLAFSDKGEWLTFSVYLSLSIIFGILLVWVGRAIAR